MSNVHQFSRFLVFSFVDDSVGSFSDLLQLGEVLQPEVGRSRRAGRRSNAAAHPHFPGNEVGVGLVLIGSEF